MTDWFGLDEKTVIVTGGAGLIGKSICRGLDECGATVIIADLNAEAGDQLADELETGSTYAEVDVTDSDDIEAVVDSTVEEFGSIDGIVNAAYPRNENYGTAYEDVDYEDWRENVDLHLGSYFYSAHYSSLQMQRQDNGGSIVNFGSTYGVQAPDFTVYEGTEMTSPVEYAAIKGGIINLTRYMASYLGDDGIRVNTVSPGGVFDGQPPEFVDRYEDRTPLGRMAEPKDIVGAVLFLVSDAAAYITGQNLVVDGGWTIK